MKTTVKDNAKYLARTLVSWAIDDRRTARNSSFSRDILEAKARAYLHAAKLVMKVSAVQ